MIRYLPVALASIAKDLARRHGRRLAHNAARGALWLALLAPFTVAAPQMTPAQVERAFQQVHGKMATLEDLIRKVEKSNEVAIARLELHQESGRSHSQYAAQIEAQAAVLQAHSLRLAEQDAVVRFVAWCIAIGVGLLAIIASVALTIRKGHKKIADEHHEICEILQRMDARVSGRRLPG